MKIPLIHEGNVREIKLFSNTFLLLFLNFYHYFHLTCIKDRILGLEDIIVLELEKGLIKGGNENGKGHFLKNFNGITA